MTQFDDERRACAAEVEQGLERVLSATTLSGPGPAPDRLIAAMRHGALGGGKRLRPLLLRQAASMFGVPPDASLTAGLAVEMEH
jgi:farnesyl diphosphate synthase